MPLPRFIAGRPRLFVALLIGLIAYLPLPPHLSPQTRMVTAWDVGVLSYLALSLLLFLREPPAKMPANARAQEEGEWTIFWITIGVVIFSFVAIFGVFSGAKSSPYKMLHIALVALTLLASWLMTQITFAFRYAHEYYSPIPGGGEIERGLEFPSEKEPDYFDFAYFAIVIGMTFQVSDVQITSRKFRRLATVHGLLSFLFNTVILALTVNIAASLF